MKPTAFFRRLMAALALMLVAGLCDAQERLAVSRADEQAVPATVYGAWQGKPECRGIALISHGAGGSEKGYGYLAEALQSRQWLAVVMGHRDSGSAALREHMSGRGISAGLTSLVSDKAAYESRFLDIEAVHRWAQARCPGKASVLLGHSMGAATTLIEAGALNRVGVRGGDRFDAYIALSPSGVGVIHPENAWAGISKPVLSITGTRDGDLAGADYQTRLQPFKGMKPGCKWQLVIDRATHSNLGGHGMSGKTEAAVIETMDAFLEGVKRGRCDAPPPARRGVEILTK